MLIFRFHSLFFSFLTHVVDWASKAYASLWGQSYYISWDLRVRVLSLQTLHRVTEKNITNTTSHWCRNLMTVLSSLKHIFIICIKHTALLMPGRCSCSGIFYLFKKYRYRIDIAIFCQYRIDIVSKLKSWYRVITTGDLAQPLRQTRFSDLDLSFTALAARTDVCKYSFFSENNTWLEHLRHTVSVQTYSTTSSRHFLLLTPCTSAVTGWAHCWVSTEVPKIKNPYRLITAVRTSQTTHWQH